ncbi:IclR family transcriptional regulator [Halococcus sp. AFM35]|uniref:IclR family transcriptional regulator n=1 Tax=Halococcus sp. AFM35 TaxID=3421653 RepID=UPI003EB8C428
MESSGLKDETAVKTTTKSLRIVEFLHEHNGAGITEIANQLELSKSTVYKHLRTLEAERYVLKGDGDVYYVGLRFLGLGVGARRQRRIYETAKPEIQRLAEESGEMANLLVEEHGRGVFLYRADSSRAVNLDTHAGREVYLHTTAMGKAILACLPERRVSAIIDRHGLPKMTEHTITDREVLFEDLDAIAEQGWAVDREERLQGLCCVATAITDPNGTPLGAISVSGPRSRLKDETLEDELPELLLDTQNVIELNVAYE